MMLTKHPLAMALAICELCGRPTEEHNRHMRFRVPDVLLDRQGWERGPDVWMSHEDPKASVMMQVPDADRSSAAYFQSA